MKCIDCGKEINKKSKRCTSCSNRYRIRSSPRTELARKRGYEHFKRVELRKKLRKIFKGKIKDLDMIKGRL